jgi:hypothetical protein
VPLKGERMQREPPPSDASRRLAEALLSAEVAKRGKALIISFDALSDSNTVHRTLLQMRDSYDPRKS